MDTIDKINYYLFLLTPLREGRHADVKKLWEAYAKISTHAPAGGATLWIMFLFLPIQIFLLTPLREGRLQQALFLFFL